jgi:hypothetical protein
LPGERGDGRRIFTYGTDRKSTIAVSAGRSLVPNTAFSYSDPRKLRQGLAGEILEMRETRVQLAERGETACREADTRESFCRR